LALIDQPTGDERAEAATWRAETNGAVTDFGGTEYEGASLSGTSLTDLHLGSESL
jgi:hypothetical protein